MTSIPINLRQEMANDSFYSQCCLSNDGLCEGRIEWHHNFIFAGKQVSEKWCILPLCEYHHRNEKIKMIKEQLDIIMLNRATDEELQKFSKAIDLIWKRDMLNDKYNKSFYA